MSEYERNKGRLRYAGIDTESFTDDDYDTYQENGFAVIDGEIYEVDWETKGAYDEPDFVEVKEDADGWISFHTCHYNGGAHWTEVVEGALDRLCYKGVTK